MSIIKVFGVEFLSPASEFKKDGNRQSIIANYPYMGLHMFAAYDLGH
jgi:hypothetical protein